MNINKLIHFFNRLAQRVTIKIIRWSDPLHAETKQKTEYESECLSICRKLISKDETVLLMSPISGKRYIKYDDGEIFIIIEHKQLTIVNHQYSYTIDIEGKPQDRLVKMFDNEIERRRMIMEEEIKSNVKHSLKTIYNNIVNEQI